MELPNPYILTIGFLLFLWFFVIFIKTGMYWYLIPAGVGWGMIKCEMGWIKEEEE